MRLLVQGTLKGGKKAADTRPVLHGEHRTYGLFINMELGVGKRKSPNLLPWAPQDAALSALSPRGISTDDNSLH